MGTYHDLCGKDAQLNTIVMAGSHDAGITGGAGYAQTQNLDIRQQAEAGVRLFDLRIAVAKTAGTTGGVKNVEMRAYHADGAAKSQELKTRFLADTGRTTQLQRSSIRVGAFGETLQKMLSDASAFVVASPTEFLILKFDKCLNWPLVAEACVGLLGDKIYRGGGNLNRKTLAELAGKVVVVFTRDGLAAAGGYTAADGICGIKNCNGGGQYDANYDGLQYYGKGGTSVMGVRPIGENKKKQKGLMSEGIRSHPEAMGMMYWTSTGLIGNIKSRNERMWSKTNSAALQKTWRAGLSESINDRLTAGAGTAAGGTMLKTFMPNIVMIDFANTSRCTTIMDLNKVAAIELQKLVVADTESFASEET